MQNTLTVGQVALLLVGLGGLLLIMGTLGPARDDYWLGAIPVWGVGAFAMFVSAILGIVALARRNRDEEEAR